MQGMKMILHIKSPSVRKVWIEIFDYDKFAAALVSPSVRKVWIEIKGGKQWQILHIVTFRKEGVD